MFTPHLLAADLDRSGIDSALSFHRETFSRILDTLSDDPSIPNLHLGQEILARYPQDLKRVLDREDVGFAGTSSILVEFGFEPGFDAEGIIRLATAAGRPIVVAHPERYAFGVDDEVAAARGWRELGARLQLNGGSLLGLYSSSARLLAEELLREGLLDLVACDNHGDQRPHTPKMLEEGLLQAGAGVRRGRPLRTRSARPPARWNLRDGSECLAGFLISFCRQGRGSAPSGWVPTTAHSRWNPPDLVVT